MLGRWEPQAIRLYRDRFIDLDALAVTIDSLAPDSARILEIGCGDGALATALWNRRSRRLNGSASAGSYLGIDPSIAEPGRMYAGDTAFATFRALFTGDLIAESSPAFDLVIVCDVLHTCPTTSGSNCSSTQPR